MFEGVLGPIWFSLCMLWIYITHGLNQLDFLFSLRYLQHAYGGVQFLQITQFISFVTGVDVRYDVVANVPIAGTYSTFIGDNYLDFGSIGSVVSGGVLGIITGYSVLGYVRGRVSMLSFPAPILLLLCLFSPVVSVVVNLWPAIVWAAIAGYSAKGWRERPRRGPSAMTRNARAV
jgi:hypothetical protein